MDNNKKSFLFAFFSVLLWSTVATAFKLALKEFDFIQLICFASGVSTIVLFIYLLISKKLKPIFNISKQQLLWAMLLGLISPFGYYLILFKAYSLLPAQLAQPLNMVWPISLALLSVPMLKQKISIRNFLALGISFIGVIFITSQGSISGFKNTNLFGVALALISSVVWAFYWILNVKNKQDEIQKLFLSIFFGFIYLLITTFIFSDFNFPKGIPRFAAIHIGIFELGITYIFWAFAMKFSTNNAKIGNLIYLTPFISLIFIHYILKETLFITTFIGLAIIVSSIFIQQPHKRH